MPDPRFFARPEPFTLRELAELTGARLVGEGTQQVHDVAPLETAGPADLSFLDNVKYAGAFMESKAGACFARERYAKQAPQGMALLITEQPYTAYTLAATAMYPQTHEPFISPHAHIGENVQMGARCRIDAGTYIGDGVVMGDDCVIGANSTITHSVLGNRVIIHRGVHIGQDGFGYAPGARGLMKVPQLGRVVIGDDVEIGSGTCIDRGAGPDTTIGDGTKIDNLVQIAHNCRIGRGVLIVSQVGIAGSTVVEDYVQLGGQVGIAGHVTIGKGAKVAARSGVMRDVPAGETVGGAPAVPIRLMHRQIVALMKLAEGKENE